MSASLYVYEVREDEGAEPDWYATSDEGWTLRTPYAVVMGGKVEFYMGCINREILRKLDAALGKKWGLS